jgi:sugar lactone lactonase YvrE
VALMAYHVECLWKLDAQLGEGPVWSARERALWFVDIKQQHIHRFDPSTDLKRSWRAPSPPGFIVPLRNHGYVVGMKTGLHIFHPEHDSFTPLREVEPAELDNRLNDAHVDAHGRLWFGSMHDPEQATTGALYKLNPDGIPVQQDTDYYITNGPCASPDGRAFYHTDTLQGVIYAFDFAANGTLSNRRVLVHIDPSVGYPDGTSIDVEGCLWVGLWNGWGVRRYSPQGELLDTIALPCANVTKAAFGGSDLQTLYITTAWKGLSADERDAQPLAGGLFAVHVDTPGLPSHEVHLG